nr:hypothetical protein GTC16762_33900 [Pigmentibacter ruber]
MTDNKIDITDVLKKSYKQRKIKENYNAHYDLNTYEEIQYMLDKNYLFDGKFIYKIVNYSDRVCKKTTIPEVKNACIHIKPPNKADNTLVSKAITVWKTETDIIATPDYIREESDLINWVLEAKTEITNISVENDPRRWLEIWLNSNQIKITANGDLYKDKKLSKSQVIRQLNCDFIANKPEKTRINLPVLKDAFYLKIEEVVEKKRKELIESLRHTKKDLNDNLGKFCKALTGTDNEVDRVVLYHFIWQVKRKMFGLKVYDHLMPIVYGTQKIGKSEAIKKLLSPIHDLYVSSKFLSITDERKSKSFERNFVMFFDEMQGATRADIENVKEKITCDRVAYRPLFTNDEEQVDNNCSFIGTSNKPLYRLIRDETGMRRFYQINAMQKCNWEAINSIDYMAIWLDVNEEIDLPFIRSKDFESKIKAQQEDNRDKHSVELWVEENEILAGTLKNEINTLYAHYSHYCRLGGLLCESKVWFSKKMIELLCLERLKSNGKVFYHLNKQLSLMFGGANETEN